jgi:hypothetical protein
LNARQLKRAGPRAALPAAGGANAMSSALSREQEQKELAPQPDQSLKKRLEQNQDEVADNRLSGYDLTFERMRQRRTGGDYVAKDQTIRLALVDIIDKGQYARSTADERFVEPGARCLLPDLSVTLPSPCTLP